MKRIPLSKGKLAMVDDDDYDWLMQWKWYAHSAHGKWYARRHEGRTKTYMHTQVSGFKRVSLVDGDGLNNQRANHRDASLCPSGQSDVKWCPRCEWTKPVQDFNFNASLTDGLQSYCRDCQRKLGAESRARKPPLRASEMSPERYAALRVSRQKYYAKISHRVRERNLAAKFAISYEEKLAMFEAQEGRCGSCFRPLPPMGVEGTKEPSVDHSHVSGKVRSLLCSRCNSSEGLLGRDFRNSFAVGAYQMNDGPYYGPITVVTDLGTWTSVIGTVDGAIGRIWQGPAISGETAP